MKLVIYGIVLSNLLNLAIAETSDEKRSQFIKRETQIENPFDLRDPFKQKVIFGKKKKKRIYSKLRNNSFTNLPSIENVPINQIKIVGVIVGEERRALAKIEGKGKQTFILKEGMKLGVDEAELKAILPGGIVLVEKIRNVYDEDEYLETIIPVTD
ncbi:MAG: hypothetical protein H6622_02540 [Halobacteriovoraceae bacterium]|nr:hypothetical protein [Halobacteriovoraceae bacterium]